MIQIQKNKLNNFLSIREVVFIKIKLNSPN